MTRIRERDFHLLLAILVVLCLSVVVLIAWDIYRGPNLEEVQCPVERAWIGERVCYKIQSSGLYCKSIEVRNGKKL